MDIKTPMTSTGIVGLAEEIAMWTTINCQPFEPSFTAHVLASLRYVTVLASLMLYVAGIRYGELYLLLFGLGSTIATALNFIIRAVVHDQTLVVPTCIDVYNFAGNWPSYQAQAATFITVFIGSYCIIYRVRPHWLAYFLLMLFFAATIASDFMLNYHTKSQITGAVIIFSVFALLFQIFLRFLILPYSPEILQTRLATYLEYRETLCAACEDKNE